MAIPKNENIFRKVKCPRDMAKYIEIIANNWKDSPEHLRVAYDHAYARGLEFMEEYEEAGTDIEPIPDFQHLN